ncbi:MAG: carbon-nitrogen hydrolase family protein [Planctomycetota bacterium]
MFDLLCETSSRQARPSVWGVLFVVIILIGVVAKVFANRGAIKVAMCQIFILDGDRQGNFIRIENAIAEAKSKGAALICFPEASILGWLNRDAHSRACTIPGPDCDQLCGLAKKYNAYLCAGLEEIETGRLYNSAILIDDQGRVLLKYRQQNIPHMLMSPPYTPGGDSDIGTVNTKFGKIGLLVCADTHSESILECMAALKPNLLLVPYGYAEQEANWPAHGQQFHQIVIDAAKRTGAAVVGTNLVGQITKGPWAGRVYGGQSIAVDKTGKIFGIAKDRDRDIKLVSITTAG